jgi:hypothetical protein
MAVALVLSIGCLVGLGIFAFKLHEENRELREKQAKAVEYLNMGADMLQAQGKCYKVLLGMARCARCRAKIKKKTVYRNLDEI